MTREDALKLLTRYMCSKDWEGNDNTLTAFGMAVEALSRERVLDKVEKAINFEEQWLRVAGYNAYNVDVAFTSIKHALGEGIFIMTRDELRDHCERQIKQIEHCSELTGVTPGNRKRYEEHNLVLELLNEDTNAMDFARWVTETIFSGKVEEDPTLFCELACRRLIKLNMVKPKGPEEWEVADPTIDRLLEKLREQEE